MTMCCQHLSQLGTWDLSFLIFHHEHHARLWSRAHQHLLVAELFGDVLARRLLKHTPRLVSDFLIHAAFLGRVNFATAELLLSSIDTFVQVILLLVRTGRLSLGIHGRESKSETWMKWFCWEYGRLGLSVK